MLEIHNVEVEVESEKMWKCLLGNFLVTDVVLSEVRNRLVHVLMMEQEDELNVELDYLLI
jgi:hypothetical protein